MKKSLTILLVCLCAWTMRAQTHYINVCSDCNHTDLTFDFNSPTDSSSYYFERDTTLPNNLWQLGTPNKTVFTSGWLAFPKAWLTDTVNPYPINNTSIFQFAILNCSGTTQSNSCGGYVGLQIGIISKINSDSTLDGGMIEVSHNGSPWMNIINDPFGTIMGDIYAQNDTVESLHQPGYSGESNYWHAFTMEYPDAFVLGYDTILFRFTFSSDSIQTNKDGWMIGSINSMGGYESIEEFQNNTLIRLAPNPAADEIQITSLIPEAADRVQIFNTTGQVVFDQSKFSASSIDISAFPNGIYILKYRKDNLFAAKRFVVQH